MSSASVLVLRLFKSGGRRVQLRRYSSGASGGHTPEGHFSSKLRHLLTRRRQEDAVETSGARESFVDAIGLSSPEDKDRVSPETIASNLCNHYRKVAESDEQRLAFLSVLAKDLSVDQDAVLVEAKHLCELHSQHRTELFTLLHSESNLRSSLTPFYLELFNVIARTDGGIKFLVDLRGDLLSTIKSSKKNNTPVHLLEEMNSQLKTVLSQWFSPQLMELYKVTWQSPCDILEKISEYEVVHPLHHWKDLKHRVGKNRRCFIFQHKAIPREPIVVLHCALTSEPSSRIKTLLDRKLEERPEDINTAVFYSVFSTQKGLSGVELGNYLIKMVAKELLKEFPQQLKNLVTLSPIPGFRRWLDSHLKQHSEQEEGCLINKEELKPVTDIFPASGEYDHLTILREVLKSREWIVDQDSSLRQALELPLTLLCARYLSVVKRRGQAMDPVAHFHLQNGASIWRVNWMANTNPQGLQNSYGMMVNYRYDLDDINRNSVSYRMSGSTALSQSVKELL